MSRALQALAFALLASLLPSCAAYTTTFHSGRTPDETQEKHQRSTWQDVAGGDEHFDLARQCPSGWADVKFEDQFAKSHTQTWRCAK
jgi:hypothetical protein